VPQVAADMLAHIARGSVPLAGVRVQRPIDPGAEQLRQAPVQAVLQHTPSTQLPFWQSALATQTCPSTSLEPQLLFTQGWPSLQSESRVQIDGQIPFTQRKNPQSRGSGAVQLLIPSHCRAVFKVVAEVQTAEPQMVVAGKVAQLLNSSHSPVVPQVVDASWAQAGSAFPAWSGVQVPSRFTMLQARQAPVQALLQQYPSTQWVEAHSTSAPHTEPFIFGPQLPPMHLRPEMQSASLLQTAKQDPVAWLQPKGAQMLAKLAVHWFEASHL
jgi:hypothetical protein